MKTGDFINKGYLTSNVSLIDFNEVHNSSYLFESLDI